MTEKEKMMEEFKNSLENMSIDELNELEKKIINEAGELDKEAAEKTFVLMENTNDELKPVTRKKMGQLVSGYIAKVDMSWQQALVLKVIVDFWRSNNNEIKFPILDNTLRLLGQVKYNGIEDIENVTYINSLFENIRDKFMEFSDKLYTVAEKHQLIMNAMDMNKTVSENK